MSDQDERRRRLAAIRDRIKQLSGDKWQRLIDGTGDLIETRRGVDGFGYEAPEPLLTFGPGCLPLEAMFFAEARADLEFLLAMLGQAFDEIRRLKNAGGGNRGTDGRAGRGDDMRGRSVPAEKPKDYAAEASMKCADPVFQKFLAYRVQASACRDADEAAVMLRQILEIDSRAQLNRDDYTARRWRDLRAEFEGWAQQ